MTNTLSVTLEITFLGMTKIRCLVVDDEKLAQEFLIHHISKFDNLHLEDTCNNVLELISFLNNNKEIELIFLDIKMPEISGIDLLQYLTILLQLYDGIQQLCSRCFQPKCYRLFIETDFS